MSGLFLNFFQVEVATKIVSVSYVSRSEYPTKEAFEGLKEKHSGCSFYSYEDKIFIWNKVSQRLEGCATSDIDLAENYKILSKILTDAIIDYSRDKGFVVYKETHSHNWELKSGKDVLKSKINGLEVNRVIKLSPYFFSKDGRKFIGFTLSTGLKSRFTWNKSQFEVNGIDTKGLKGKDDIIFANTHSLKRFLESKGLTEQYKSLIEPEKTNAMAYRNLEKMYLWLERHKSEFNMPFGLKVLSIKKRYLPFEDGLIKSEVIWKPERYFYSNRSNTKKLRFYDQMVKEYQPYSLEMFQDRKVDIGVLCPAEYQGETEGFIRKIELKLKEVFHFENLKCHLITINDRHIDSYKHAVYHPELLQCQLIYVVVEEAHEKLHPNDSPYYVCKAKFMGNGIPTQDIQIETIRTSLNAFTMTNIALNSYAKMGGTAWTIEKEDKLRDELIVGVGSTVSDNGKYVLGIAQVFHNDGRYMTGDCSPLSTFDNYSQKLEEHLYNTLVPLLDEMRSNGRFRLIFHLFKSASERYEIKAIENLKMRLEQYDFEFALVHLGYGHNFRLYYNDGVNDISQGTYVQITKNIALLHFVKESDLPLKIEIDKRSTFNSLFYIAKQVYWFSHLSHRSYIPSKRTVTIMYPSLMSKMTEELKKVDSWDFERLNAVSDKLWFI